ncbi:MAG: hypothetical protein VX737_00855 [Pseudomonadota bacterium]|nr:hypothetical protein [Pseudomonadota bacterium]
MKAVIMSEPVFTNGFSSVDNQHAHQQWQQLHDLILKLGIPVYRLPNVPYIDRFYAMSQHGLIYGNQCLLAHNRDARCQYGPYLKAWISESPNFSSLHTAYPRYHRDNKHPQVFSGSADAILVDSTFYMGYGTYTNIEVANDLTSVMKTRTVELSLLKPNSHLIDSILPINSGQIFYQDASLNPQSASTLAESFSLICAQDDPTLYPTHSLIYGLNAICSDNCVETIKNLIQLGYEVHTVEMSFFQSLGLGPLALTLPVL